MSELNSDLLDDGLQAVMGKDRCRNDWMPTAAKRICVDSPEKKEIPVDASWVPLKEEPTELEIIIASAKALIPYGTISILTFTWWQMELMAEIVAVPSCIAMAMLAGFRLGHIWRSRNG